MSGDFQHDDPRCLLADIEKRIKELCYDASGDAAEDSDLITYNIGLVDQALNYIGYVLRSTNVRNAFEAYLFLKKLLAAFLDERAGLILSSEWSYSPFLFNPAYSHEFGNYAIVGLPASESGNALVMPVAGHEIGHVVWDRYFNGNPVVDAFLTDKIQTVIASRKESAKTILGVGTDDFSDTRWTSAVQPAKRWALRQCEELFCDFIAIYVFGKSYLQAFEYLLTPRPTEARPPWYPDIRSRAEYANRVCLTYHGEGVANFDKRFLQQSSALQASDLKGKFLCDVADLSVQHAMSELTESVKDLCEQKKVPRPCRQACEGVKTFFAKLCPAGNVRCNEVDRQPTVAEICVAGWETYEDPGAWRGMDLLDADKRNILDELMFKSMELWEIARM